MNYKYAPACYERATHFYYKDECDQCIHEISENPVNSGIVCLRTLAIDDPETEMMFEECGWIVEDRHFHITKNHLRFEIADMNLFAITDMINDTVIYLNVPIEYAFASSMNIIQGMGR